VVLDTGLQARFCGGVILRSVLRRMDRASGIWVLDLDNVLSGTISQRIDGVKTRAGQELNGGYEFGGQVWGAGTALVTECEETFDGGGIPYPRWFLVKSA
jgi:hypothetical protein